MDYNKEPPAPPYQRGHALPLHQSAGTPSDGHSRRRIAPPPPPPGGTPRDPTFLQPQGPDRLVRSVSGYASDKRINGQRHKTKLAQSTADITEPAHTAGQQQQSQTSQPQMLSTHVAATRSEAELPDYMSPRISVTPSDPLQTDRASLQTDRASLPPPYSPGNIGHDEYTTDKTHGESTLLEGRAAPCGGPGTALDAPVVESTSRTSPARGKFSRSRSFAHGNPLDGHLAVHVISASLVEHTGMVEGRNSKKGRAEGPFVLIRALSNSERHLVKVGEPAGSRLPTNNHGLRRGHSGKSNLSVGSSANVTNTTVHCTRPCKSISANGKVCEWDEEVGIPVIQATLLHLEVWSKNRSGLNFLGSGFYEVPGTKPGQAHPAALDLHCYERAVGKLEFEYFFLDKKGLFGRLLTEVWSEEDDKVPTIVTECTVRFP